MFDPGLGFFSGLQFVKTPPAAAMPATNVGVLDPSAINFMTHLMNELFGALENLKSMQQTLQTMELCIILMTGLMYVLTVMGAIGFLCSLFWKKHKKSNMREEHQRQMLLHGQHVSKLGNSSSNVNYGNYRRQSSASAVIHPPKIHVQQPSFDLDDAYLTMSDNAGKVRASSSEPDLAVHQASTRYLGPDEIV